MLFRIVFCFWLLSIIFFNIPLSVASSAAGVEIHTGHFEIRVSYSVTEDYGDELKYIRDPSQLLFDLTYLIQKNYQALSQQKAVYWIEVSAAAHEISILKQDSKTEVYNVFKEKKYKKKQEKEALRQAICDILNFTKEKCECDFSEKEKTITLYQAKSEIKNKQANRLLFGAFPSDQTSKNFVIHPGDLKIPLEKQVLKPGEMTRFFHTLD